MLNILIVFALCKEESDPWLGAWLRRVVLTLVRRWESAEVKSWSFHDASRSLFVFHLTVQSLERSDKLGMTLF